MESKERKTQKKGGALILLGVLIAILAICLFVFEIPGLWAQLLAIIASAFLGAGVTAWVTNSLLDRQQAVEEEKEKNIKIHQSKIDVYSKFIREVWNQAAESDAVDKEALKPIRSLIFNKLIFYLDKAELTELKELFNKDKMPKNRIQLYSQITDIVRRDVDNNNDKKREKPEGSESYTELVKGLWNAISNIIGNEQIEESSTPLNKCQDEPAEQNIISEAETLPNAKTIQDYGFNQAWHFAMLGDEQIKCLSDGKHELSLIEYEEDWRTNMVKQVDENDVVFLFRRGGFGYLGAFKPKGWRVFDYNINKETVYYFGKTEIEKQGSEFDADVEQYDIYDGFNDGASLCTNLIVEPIAYIESGVGNPGGVYRRTISRYDAGYAAELMEMFKQHGCAI